MNKYVMKASLVLLGEIAAWSLAVFLLYVCLVCIPTQFILCLFFIAAISIVLFMITLVSAAKNSIMRRAREYARKDGIHV